MGVSDVDLHLLETGRHLELHHRLGAHVLVEGGVRFAVWAPSAAAVSVVGDWNHWVEGDHPMQRAHGSGVWEVELPVASGGDRYKFAVTGHDGTTRQHADPLALRTEVPPGTASIVHRSRHRWGDEAWVEERRRSDPWSAPVSIYEVHVGSWRRDPTEPGRERTFREIAPELAAYVSDLGFTHVELMPVMGHPYGGSWGYQVTSFFAPAARWGTPDDLEFLIDTLHQAGIGVILDWVPAHFPKDGWALARFDGTTLYEHSDPRRGEHPDWGTLVFDHGRGGVRSFLLSSAELWLDRFHVDGLRVDAVASMLYLDYSRRAGEWLPNAHGGREDLDAISFFRDLHDLVRRRHPGTLIIAEESTAWPGVTAPPTEGGLGFDAKWNMGWMHDTLAYLSHEPVHRKHHHRELTFPLHYAFDERFVLPLSHDEVVHLKRPLVGKMPGDRWQRFANLRALYGWMWAHPGKKLLFMGGELAQDTEWDHDRSLSWHLLDDPDHSGVQSLIRDLNAAYRDHPALWAADAERDRFEWLIADDADRNVAAFLRTDPDGDDVIACVANFSPVPRHRHRVGLPLAGRWREVVSTDSSHYAGGGIGNLGAVSADGPPAHGQPTSAELTVPPLAVVWLSPHRPRRGARG